MTAWPPFSSGTSSKQTSTGTSANIALPAQNRGTSAIIYNAGTQPIIFVVGTTSALTAVVLDGTWATGAGEWVVAPGTTQTFTIGDAAYIAWITQDGSTSCVFYISIGEGE